MDEKEKHGRRPWMKKEKKKKEEQGKSAREMGREKVTHKQRGSNVHAYMHMPASQECGATHHAYTHTHTHLDSWKWTKPERSNVQLSVTLAE